MSLRPLLKARRAPEPSVTLPAPPRQESPVTLIDEDLLSQRHALLLAEIPLAGDYRSLRALHDQLNDIEMQRFLASHSVPALHQKCTAYRDALAARAVELVAAELPEPPPLPFALVSMGSDGREEQTLITDQDYLVVYASNGDATADEYFRGFSELAVERLAEIGFKKCTGDIMPSDPRWRGSLHQWQKRLVSMVRFENADYSRNVMDLIILSDARFVAGDRPLAERLIERIRGLEREYFQALWGMAKVASEMKLALTFLKRLWTERSGPHKGELNLKLLAWAPLVMNVRILAMNQGVPATNTIRRVEILEAEGSLGAQTAAGLREAYRVLTSHRVLLQIAEIEGRRSDTYYLDPLELSREEREEIRRSLLKVAELQRIIRINFSIM